MAAEVERSQTIQFADPSQINEESQESVDTKTQTVNFDDNFQLMEAEYVEEEEDKDSKLDESSKPSLQQTISFSQNNKENSDNNQFEEDDEVNEEDKEAEEARIREGQNNPFSIYYKKKDAGSDNQEEHSAASESTKKSNKRKREERDYSERNSDDETLVSLKKQKISHNKDENSEIQIEVSEDEGRKEKKKKKKHKRDKKEKKHKKDKKEKRRSKKKAQREDGSSVVEETSQDPEKFLETLKQLGADSDDEDDPEFSKKLEKKLEHQRMLPMAKKIRAKKAEPTLQEGDGEPVVQEEDDDWFLKDEVGSFVGELPPLPTLKQSPKKKQKRQQTALGAPTRKAEFEKDSVQARMLRDADVRIEPKKAARLDVAALLKKVEQRTKQIPTFHMNQEVPEDEDMDLEIDEDPKPRLTYDNPEEILMEDSHSSNDLAAFVAKDSQDASSKHESDDEDVETVAFILPPEEDPDAKAIHEILNRAPQATFHDPSMTQGAPTMSLMTESVVAPFDTMTAENSTQIQVPSEASNDSTEEQKTEEQKAVLKTLTDSNAGPALHLHYTQTQFVHASDLPEDSEDSNDKPEEVVGEKSNAAPVTEPVVAPVVAAEKPVEEVISADKPAENTAEAKKDEVESEEEKEYDSEADEDDAEEDDLSMVEHGDVDSGDEDNALSLHQRKLREEEDAEMRYISKITSGRWRDERERNLDIMNSDEEEDDEDEEDETSRQSGDSKDRKRKRRSNKNKRKNPYANHALIDEKELIDDEEDEAKEEEEIQKLKERVHKRNYLTVSFKSNSFLEEDKSSQGLLKMIEKSQTQSQSMSLSYSQSAEVMHDIAQDFLPNEAKSVLARSKKQLNRLASSFKPQTMYSSFIFNSNSRGASGGDSNGSDENVNPNVSQSQDGTASNKTPSGGSKASRPKSVTKSKTSFFRVLEESSQQF
jgi:hypothetical protein